MNNNPSTSKTKHNDDFEDDEIFEDSSFLAKFDDSSKQISKFANNNINDSLNKSALNVSALCCDEEISGYDKLTGKTWIYPTNYPVRDYQFNIIKAALLKNTLVSLPTGLGKTFIAAVIMYNFYRWYPLGKIVFTAPTRPLVAQQIEACYNIIAIPPNDTIEMTGHMNVNTRKLHWQNKRVFFATPQVIYNDMKSGDCPCDKVRCLIFDEAHKAQRNYAYCQIVSTLDDIGHKTYRVLALSATPGSKVEDVTNVVRNLHIAHLELRTEDCMDVAPYSHARKINTVIIKLDAELTQLKQNYIEILDGYARRLKQMNILPQNLGNLSKGRIVMLYKEYQTKDRSSRHVYHNHIIKDFTLLIALYHGLELMVKHGSRVFLNFFDEHPEKSWIQSDDRLTALLERLRDDLGVNPLSLDRSILPDGTIPEMPKDLCFGHPKFDKLKNIMMDHFTKAKHKKQDTRAIVFCEYRESVNLVHCLLLQCRPLIKPQMFVGQGASGKDGKTVVSQKQQVRVMNSFRKGECNVLVATCVAEEGLDVGSVDLILCFDISTKSPIRLVQRCGRTGRERGGQVYILVTEGKEHQTLLDCMRQRDGLNKRILQSEDIRNNLYKLNPRMMPHDFTPQCQKMYITVEQKPEPKEKNKDAIDKPKKGQKDLRTMLAGKATSRSSSSSNKERDSILISENEFKELFPDGYRSKNILTTPREYWAMNRDTVKEAHNSEASEIKLSKWLEWQRRLQKSVNIHHSRDTEILVDLLQYSDAKRFEMPPSTQNPCFGSQELPTQQIILNSPSKLKQPKKKQKAPVAKKEGESGKKDGDIRALFSTATKSTKSYTKSINDLGLQNNGTIPTRLISLLVDLNLDSTKSDKICHFCENIGDCSVFQHIRAQKKASKVPGFLKEVKLPDLDLIADFDVDTIKKCMNESDDSLPATTNNLDLETDFLSDNELLPAASEPKDQNKSSASDHFDIGDIADIFADSSSEESIEKESAVREARSKEANDALGFFGLDSIDDIFADDVIDHTPPESMPKNTKNDNNNKVHKSPATEYPLSPSLLSGRQKAKDVSTSPILCSQPRKFNLTTKKDQAKSQSTSPVINCRKQLLKEPTNNNNIILGTAMKQNILAKDCPADTSNKSLMTITQLVEMINTTTDTSATAKCNVSKQVETEERSMSPILLTQAERYKSSASSNTFKSLPSTSQAKISHSLIILDSDSDSDGTQIYDATEHFDKIGCNKNKSTKVDNSTWNNKRKLDNDESDAITASPYFNKKPKFDIDNDKQMTLQEKVLAVITSDKLKRNNTQNDRTVLNCVVSPTNFLSQKENKNPQFLEDTDEDDYSARNKNLNALQMFRRDSKLEINKNKFCFNKKSPIKADMSQKRKLTFDDSDDDFVNDEKSSHGGRGTLCDNTNRSTTNHKVRRKKKKARVNVFLDMEAELSDGEANSGDELSDESVGSIVDFICDDNITHHEDIQAVYLKSIKSPVRGGFKIPELPKRFNKEDVLSQYVEEDAYEMDSFCVDSHIGFTQVNEVSELELAELVLEQERKAKKKSRRICSQDDSPVALKLRNKPKRRLIDSDSDDSG